MIEHAPSEGLPGTLLMLDGECNNDCNALPWNAGILGRRTTNQRGSKLRTFFHKP